MLTFSNALFLGPARVSPKNGISIDSARILIHKAREHQQCACFVESKENKWVGSWQSWSKEGTVRHCQSKEVSILWSHQKKTWEKEIIQGTIPGPRRRGRPRTAWMYNINTWTGLLMEVWIRMTEDWDNGLRYSDGDHVPFGVGLLP